ncbi:hypothetical protein C1646_696431 [Rhizophagus diaphanus]|nr:hypothetical protein C1646_696431 [Rhizophagus diaphanus] [Rhizophagus sp. MUCL 43196]
MPVVWKLDRGKYMRIILSIIMMYHVNQLHSHCRHPQHQYRQPLFLILHLFRKNRHLQQRHQIQIPHCFVLIVE